MKEKSKVHGDHESLLKTLLPIYREIYESQQKGVTVNEQEHRHMQLKTKKKNPMGTLKRLLSSTSEVQ